MDSKSRWWSKPLLVALARAAQAAVSLRVGIHAQQPVAARKDATSDFRRPMQPSRECGTWYAFGLAVSLHALVAVALLPELHRPDGFRAGRQQLSATSTVNRAARLPSGAAPLQVTPQSAVSHAATSVSRLAAILPQTSPQPHQKKSGMPHPQRKVRLASHPSTVHRDAFVPVAGAREAPAEVSTDREHDARVAALQAMAGASLSSHARSERERDAAASPGYAGRVARRLRANVVAPFAIEGNPSAIVEVTCAPNGALLGATIRRSSGNPQWDRAVLSAVEKSAPMPVDVNGTAPASFTITFQPKG